MNKINIIMSNAVIPLQHSAASQTNMQILTTAVHSESLSLPKKHV
jgi:hypothetical protein